MQISRARGGKGKLAKIRAICGSGRAGLRVSLKLKQEIGITLAKLNRKWLKIQRKRHFGASSQIRGPFIDGACPFRSTFCLFVGSTSLLKK
jgi:hypothetical protein